MDKLQVESGDVEKIKEPNLITSTEVLKRTGISRAMLNEYIKMGILPGLVVQKTGQDTQGINQVSYFPESVVWRIELVKKLEREGEPMEKIAKQFAGDSSTVELFPYSNDKKQFDSTSDTFIQTENGNDTNNETFTDFSLEKDPAKSAPFHERKNDVKLTVSHFDLPAYLVNSNFEIEWINSKAEEMIFNLPVGSIEKGEARNIFKLFLSPEFQSCISNWKDIVSYHLTFVQDIFEKHSLSKMYPGISGSESSFSEDSYDAEKEHPQNPLTHRPIRLELSDGSAKYYQIYSMNFGEGLFFAFSPEDQQQNGMPEYLSKKDGVNDELLKQRTPAIVPLCVLVADLQDSAKIRAELLPMEYFKFINDLWESLADCCDKYGGIYGRHAGDGILYYFLEETESDYIMNSVNCALDLRQKMRQFSSKWKDRIGWNEDMYLNIGISEGQEFCGTIRTPTVEFTAMGDSINYAGRLSDFARYGEIWTTKSVIEKMDPEKVKSIQFGITRTVNDRPRFAQHAFSRIIDLLKEDDKINGKFIDIANLPVTQIMEYQQK